MAVVCPVCREVVQSYSGVILYHGVHYHDKFIMCAGSYLSYPYKFVHSCCN